MGADGRLFCAIRLRKRTNLSVLVTSEPDELSIQDSLPGARVQRAQLFARVKGGSLAQ